jgi:hypothetical protein
LAAFARVHGAVSSSKKRCGPGSEETMSDQTDKDRRATAEHQAESDAVRQNMTKLRQERQAREAAAAKASEPKKKPKANKTE